jgi:hypothetical protein
VVAGWFFIVLGALALLVIILLCLAVYSYRRLEISFKTVSACPDFKFKPASVIGSLFSAFTGNYIAAAGGFINGVRLDGRISVLNHSFVPLYLPAIDHEVFIGGKSCAKMIHTPALWLKPRRGEAIPISITLNTNDIPQVALAGLSKRGVIDVEIQSRVALGGYSLLKTTRTAVNIPDHLPKLSKGDKKPVNK